MNATRRTTIRNQRVDAEFLRAHGWKIRGVGLSAVWELDGKTWVDRRAAVARQRRLCAAAGCCAGKEAA